MIDLVCFFHVRWEIPHATPVIYQYYKQMTTKGGRKEVTNIMRLIALSIAAVLGTLVLGASGQVAHAAPTKDIKKDAPAQMVTIQPGDSLSKIATAKNSTIQRLFDANDFIVNPDLIYPGDKLRVPTPDETLTDRPMPNEVAAAPVAATPQVAAAPVVSSYRTQPVQAAPVAGGSVWDQLAACESGGNWAISTGNGFYGGLQFTPSSWRAVGGSGLPNQASREEQIMRAEALQARQGWGAWPACSAKLGLR